MGQSKHIRESANSTWSMLKEGTSPIRISHFNILRNDQNKLMSLTIHSTRYAPKSIDLSTSDSENMTLTTVPPATIANSNFNPLQEFRLLENSFIQLNNHANL